jgi:hypothetical protein
MKRPVRLLIVLLLALLTVTAPLLVIHAVRADAAPPPGAAASDVVPDQGTQVQMISETVVLEVGASQRAGYIEAFVTADFLMRNLGPQTEAMDVRFPMAWPSAWGTPRITIQNVEVAVDDQPVMMEQVDFEGQPWAVWPATFPPGTDVRLRVTYHTAATSWYGRYRYGNLSLAEFYYILETGAGWRGPIGQGDIIFRFPHPASLEMIEPHSASAVYTSTTPAFVVDGNDLRWHFTDLEPTATDNVRLGVITPSVWDRILDARRRAQANPDDAEVQIYLGESYAAAIPSTNYGPAVSSLTDHFGSLAEAAYERAIELAPDSVQAHFSYAMFLRFRTWDELSSPGPSYTRALEEAKHVLELDPENADIKAAFGVPLETVQAQLQATPALIDPTQEQTDRSEPGATALPAPWPMTATPDAKPGATTPHRPTVEASPTPGTTISPTPIASPPSPDRAPWLMWIGVMLLVVAFAAVILRRS